MKGRTALISSALVPDLGEELMHIVMKFVRALEQFLRASAISSSQLTFEVKLQIARLKCSTMRVIEFSVSFISLKRLKRLF